MDNPILNAEQFSTAVYNFADTVNSRLVPVMNGLSDNVESLNRAVSTFNDAVSRLARIQGMVAENDQRKAIGASMAYTEEDFANV